MSRKIQFHTFHLLFRLFSYLADKSGGWSMFVRPKLVMGALIVGFGFHTLNTSADNTKINQTPRKKNKAVVKKKVKRQETKQQSAPEESYSAILCYAVDFSKIDNTPNEATGKSIIDEKGPFIIVEEMPQYPGGEEAMKKFIEKEIGFPQELVKDKKRGIVICSFVVNKDGSISNIEVVRGIQPSLNAEAVRVIKLFPKWIPGKQDYMPVPVKYTLLIFFPLPENKL